MRFGYKMVACLILPKIVLCDKQVVLDPFGLQQYILTKFVGGKQPVTKYIGFGNDGA